MRLFSLALVACFSLNQLKSEGCRVLCLRDGYTSGYFQAPGCRCVDQKDTYDNFIVRRVGLGTRDPVAPFIQDPKSSGQIIYNRFKEDYEIEN